MGFRSTGKPLIRDQCGDDIDCKLSYRAYTSYTHSSLILCVKFLALSLLGTFLGGWQFARLQRILSQLFLKLTRNMGTLSVLDRKR